MYIRVKQVYRKKFLVWIASSICQSQFNKRLWRGQIQYEWQIGFASSRLQHWHSPQGKRLRQTKDNYKKRAHNSQSSLVDHFRTAHPRFAYKQQVHFTIVKIYVLYKCRILQYFFYFQTLVGSQIYYTGKEWAIVSHQISVGSSAEQKNSHFRYRSSKKTIYRMFYTVATRFATKCSSQVGQLYSKSHDYWTLQTNYSNFI